MPASPSLLIVPARFKTGKLYTQIATTSAGLVLGSSGDFNVTRATTATRFNSAGLIESVASGVPRLDYYTSGGTAGCPALLVEASGTNLALHSRDLSNVIWVKTSITAAKNAVGADGTVSGATRLTATAASGTVLQALVNVSQSRVFSAYIRRVSGTGAIQLTTNGGTNWDTVTISSLYTQVFCTAQTILNGSVGIRMAVSGDVIEVDFTQGEVGPVATSPIATTTAAVTRNGDVVTLSGAVSGCIGQTEGTIYAEFEIRSDTTTRRLFALSDGTQTNRIFLYYTSNALRAQIQGTDISLGNPAAGYHKVAFAYQQSGVSGTLFASLDGGAVVSGTTAGTFPSALNAVFIGKREDSADQQQWNARIRSAALYTSRLSNAELIALSTL